MILYNYCYVCNKVLVEIIYYVDIYDVPLLNLSLFFFVLVNNSISVIIATCIIPHLVK
jgi:hypothetical protein